MMPGPSDARFMDANQLLTAWGQARAEGLNNRAAAAKLGLSEAELIASACGRFVTRLLPQPLALLRSLPWLGEIKTVVRNPAAVIERDATVQSVEGNGVGAILVKADNFEMLCEIAQWKRAFALREESTRGRGLKLSVQFFTAEGTSAAKFFLLPGSDVHAFAQVTGALASPDQSSQETIDSTAEAFSPAPGRLTLAGPDALQAFLEAAAQSRLPLTFVVRNRVACLYASKAIERVKRSDRSGWVNVLDEGMDVHLHDDRIQYLRCVPEPGADGGWVHWYSDRQEIALSARCPHGWRALIQSAGAPA
jgi:putative heme degradation protein